MKLGTDGATYLSLPPNFQTMDMKCLGHAVDIQVGKLMEFAKKVLVWSDLEHVDPRYYDQLAASLRAPYYASEYDDGTRLDILKETLQTYMFAGTAFAIENLLSKMFNDARFVRWDEYGGEPFHFKIVFPGEADEDILRKFAEILQKVKSTRSIIDGLETATYTYDIRSYIATGIWMCERLEEVND